jgi:hypothetical protein
MFSQRPFGDIAFSDHSIYRPVIFFPHPFAERSNRREEDWNVGVLPGMAATYLAGHGTGQQGLYETGAIIVFGRTRRTPDVVFRPRQNRHKLRRVEWHVSLLCPAKAWQKDKSSRIGTVVHQRRYQVQVFRSLIPYESPWYISLLRRR